MSYLRKSYGTKETPQSEPIPGSTQTHNNAGGFAWAIDDWQRLQRFLVLGSEGGTYYVKERELTKDNVQSTLRCIKEDGPRVVQELVDVSVGGRAPKNDPALFVLAACSGVGDEATRKLALTALPEVARIGTHLLHFADYVQQWRGWGRGLRTAVGNWYNQKDVDELAYQVVKYQRRDKWANSDLLRLAHPIPPSLPHKALYKWIVDGDATEGIFILDGYIQLQGVKDDKAAAELVSKYRLPMECVPTEFKASPRVWEAALPHLGLTAIIRNLGNLSKCGVLKQGARDKIQFITGKLLNPEALKAARIHPIAVLAALTTYSSGRGVRGSGEWDVVPDIVDALDQCFYLAFGNVEPTNKEIVLALDVSGSMAGGEVAGVPGLSPRMAAAAMAMVTYAVEPKVTVLAFMKEVVPLDISRRKTLKDVVKATSNLDFGGTDCAQPMLWAIQNKLPAEAFIVYTDSETWAGHIHPTQALNRHRTTFGVPSKLVVVGMVANDFSIADPNDAGMLDVVGFDTATPQVMSQFISAGTHRA